MFSPSLAAALGEVLHELDPALSDSCFSYGEQSVLSGAKNMEEEVKTASSNDPPPPEEKQPTGKPQKVCLMVMMFGSIYPITQKAKDYTFCSISLSVYITLSLNIV